MHPVPPLHVIKARLPHIFPEGLEDRTYCVRDIAAATIFVMFYVDAVEGSERYLRPSQVTLMSPSQAALTDDESRAAFVHATLTGRKKEKLVPPRDRWYKENTREPIRDETLGDGLLKYGAVSALPLPVTSQKPRYALTSDFARLFLCQDEDFPAAAEAWRTRYLSADAIRRVKLLQQGALAQRNSLIVQFPNGAGQFQMSPGPSSVLTQAFVEKFAETFLTQPVVLFISDSGNKADKYLNDRARSLGLNINVTTLLPDVLLVDLGCEPMRFVFAEMVASDGPIRGDRKAELLQLAASAGIAENDCSFVTVFNHRDSAQFKKAVNSLAWDSFVWFMNEPDKLLVFDASSKRLKDRR